MASTPADVPSEVSTEASPLVPRLGQSFTYLQRALRAAAYPLQGIWVFVRHPEFYPLFASRLLPLSIISFVVYFFLFSFLFIPQYLLLAIFHGWGAWVNATFLTLGEGSVVSEAVFECFFADKGRVLIFDAILVMKGLTDLVAPHRTLHLDAPNSVKMLGKAAHGAEYSPFSFIQVIEFVVSLPLNLIPIVGAPAFIMITGWRMGTLSHYRWYQLRGLNRRERKLETKALLWDFFWFGSVAMLADLVPVLRFLFQLTTSAGSALWVVDMEMKSRTTMRNQAVSARRGRSASCRSLDDPV